MAFTITCGFVRPNSTSEAELGNCAQCTRLEATRRECAAHYVELTDARKALLQEGRLLTPALIGAIARAETRLNEAASKLEGHRSTHAAEH